MLLLPEYPLQQPPDVQVAPEIVYRTVQNEQGILQNPTGWFVSQGNVLTRHVVNQ